MTDQYQPHYVPHDDLASDARDRVLQGLATVATLFEAGARIVAVDLQNRAAERERQAGRDQAAAAAQQQADALAEKVRGERQKMANSLDGDWLTNHASFQEAAHAWRTATVHATGDDPVAAKVADLAEQRLRKVRPDLMDAYDRFRQTGPHGPGLPIHEAMRAAAREVWETDARNYQPPGPTARPHGNTRPVPELDKDGPAALPAGGSRVLDDLDRQVRLEVAELAQHVRPEALDELQRLWRARGQLPPGDPTELLRAYVADAVRSGKLQPAAADAITGGLDAQAAAERSRGRQASGATDDPRTGVDEHTAGQVDSVRRDDAADQAESATAALRHGQPAEATPASTAAPGPARPVAAQAFPGPLRVGAVNPIVANKRPAQTTSARTIARAR